MTIEYPEMFGQCFDANGLQMYHMPIGAKLVHGIGIANAPGQEGKTIAHAWIEYKDKAYDSVWKKYMSIDEYRKLLKVSYSVDYTFDEMFYNWKRTNFPGPWDEKIRALCKD